MISPKPNAVEANQTLDRLGGLRAVEFDYMQRKEIIKVAIGTGVGEIASLPGFEPPQGEMAMPQFEERWTGGYIFENVWQSFRTRQNRELELTTAVHTYDRSGRYTVAFCCRLWAS